LSSSPLLKVEDLQIRARLGTRERTIVTAMELSVTAGETIGIVGESGSGKSMTARALIGLLPSGLRATGSVAYGGRNLIGLSERAMRRFRGDEIGLVFQDPFTMLSPLRRCGRHIDEMLRDERGKLLSTKARHAEAVRRLAEVGIRDASVANRYPFELSGGMRQRVGIAAALAQDPKLLIADEPSTALDVTTQREILALLKSLQESRGMGLIMITHDLRVAFSMCDRIYVLYAGSLLEVGASAAIEAEPLHPYTLGLLLSEPPGDRRLSTLPSIQGAVPEPDDVAARCPFSPRCEWATATCTSGATPLRRHSSARSTSCVRIDEIRGEMEAKRRLAARGEHADVVSSESPVLVSTNDVHKIFVSGERRAIALAGVSLEIRENESVGLVGESGSGKTTLGRCLVGLETPTSGSIRIAGMDASDYESVSADERRTLRRTAQIVFQDPYSSLNPFLTVGYALREALTVNNPRLRGLDTAVRTLLESVGLPASYAARKPVALSGGERQRVAIARALAVHPKLLVCDEPVSALDVSVQAQILNLFKSLREELGMSYLFITHDLAVVRQVVERVYVLYEGEIVEAGPVDRVLDSPEHEYTKRLVDSIPRADAEWLRSARSALPPPTGPRELTHASDA
jgi:peptide/nickel transport system ATP-binding protein